MFGPFSFAPDLGDDFKLDGEPSSLVRRGWDLIQAKGEVKLSGAMVAGRREERGEANRGFVA